MYKEPCKRMERCIGDWRGQQFWPRLATTDLGRMHLKESLFLQAEQDVDNRCAGD